jgi:hypothetical protein
LRIDGRTVASIRHELTHSNDDYPVAQVNLSGGSHQVALTLGGVDLHPGSGGNEIVTSDGSHLDAFAVGPVLMGTGPDDHPITYVAPSAARSLCGRRLDWVEALGT